MATKTEKDLWVEMSIREIWTQAHFAEIAYSHIDPKAISGTDAVFSSIHSFLSHCAMVSKMLKATENSAPQKSIGDVLGIPNNSVIHEREFRNHLEHYDERLTKWIGQYGPDANIGTYNIGSRSAFRIKNFVFVSHYDSDTQTFTFVNEDFNLGTMMSEVEKVKSMADNWVKGVEGKKINPPFI